MLLVSEARGPCCRNVSLLLVRVDIGYLISYPGQSSYNEFILTFHPMWSKPSWSVLSFLHSRWCSSIMALLAIILATINLLHCILQQSTHPQFYLQSSNSHHVTGNVWRECVFLVTKSPINPQTASEAKMDTPICTPTVKDRDKGFYITLWSCSKPTQKHTIHPEWTDPLFSSWQYLYMWLVEEAWTDSQFQPTLKWTMVGSKSLSPQKNPVFLFHHYYLLRTNTLMWNYISYYCIDEPCATMANKWQNSEKKA